jgi:hypothetical protein
MVRAPTILVPSNNEPLDATGTTIWPAAAEHDGSDSHAAGPDPTFEKLARLTTARTVDRPTNLPSDGESQRVVLSISR